LTPYLWQAFKKMVTVVVQVARVAPSSLVLRGSVQLIACVATQLTTCCEQQLAAVSVADWRLLRSQLEQHRINRVEQLHFRRSPADYLALLETQLL
jgi:hypothetical protein